MAIQDQRVETLPCGCQIRYITCPLCNGTTIILYLGHEVKCKMCKDGKVSNWEKINPYCPELHGRQAV